MKIIIKRFMVVTKLQKTRIFIRRCYDVIIGKEYFTFGKHIWKNKKKTRESQRRKKREDNWLLLGARAYSTHGRACTGA